MVINYLFLDLTLKRKKEKIQFEIFRKETHTYRYIPINSNYSWKHNIAWYID